MAPFRRYLLLLALLVATLTWAVWGPSREMRVFEAQVQEFVRRRAPVVELYAQFGQPRHTESQANIRQRLAETSPSDTVYRLYQRMAEFSEIVTIQLPDKSGDLLAFLDDHRRVVGYYLNIQL